MTDNEIIKAIDKVINRKYPEGVVPSAICTIEFFKGIRNIIDGYRKEAAYFEDRIDDINSEKNDIICELRGEIERLKKDYEIYEEASGLKWAKAEAIREFAERLKELLLFDRKRERTIAVVTEREIDNLVKEMTEEKNDTRT